MNRETNTIFITGGLGWLGKRLTRLLASDSYEHLVGDIRRIYCLVMPGQNAAELEKMGDRVEVITGDICRPADCERFLAGARGAVLIHTAGIIHPRRVAEFYEVNLNGTKNLIAAAQKSGLRRAVIVSSNSPIGCNPHSDHLFDEQSPYNPYMNYGRSKMLMEEAVIAASNDGALETVIMRPPWFYGPDQPPRQTQFFQMIKDGKGPIVGDGENLRSMGYVDNLCQALALGASHPNAPGQIYWIADRRPYTMNEIIDTIERLLENEFAIRVAHKRMRLPGFASTAAEWADLCIQGFGMYQQKIHVLSEMNKTIACSVTKAERELGFRPEIALEEGMRRSIAWCIQQGIQI